MRSRACYDKEESREMNGDKYRGKRNKGVSLIELVLAAGIAVLVMTTVFSGFSLGIKVFRRTTSDRGTEALEVLSEMTGSLRAAYLPKKKTEGFFFTGRTKSIDFVTSITMNERRLEEYAGDLRNISYVLKDNSTGERELVYRREKGKDRDGNPIWEEKILSGDIEDIGFEFHDGKDWRMSWSSGTDLPLAVRIILKFRERDVPGSGIFMTVADIKSGPIEALPVYGKER